MAACQPSGPAFATSIAADLAPVQVIAGEPTRVAYAVALARDGVDGKRPPALTYGVDLAWNVDGDALVRVVTTRADGGWVPTPWDIDGADAFDVPQATGPLDCARRDEACAAQYLVELEVREGAEATVSAQAAAWASGAAGSAERVGPNASLDLTWSDPG